jgi:circadian clock protein KaiC
MATEKRGMRAKRVSSGIKGLDTVLSGGFLQGGVYIFIGPPGAGKTILANQIAFAHAASGGRVLYVSLLAESHARLFMHMENLDFFDESRVAESMNYVSGYTILEKEGLPGLLTLLRKEMQSRKATMLVLDGLVSAEAFAQTSLEMKKFIHELQTIVALLECTAFLLTSGSNPQLGTPEHTMVDGLIELTNDVIGVRQLRLLNVKKFRGSQHLGGTHCFDITSRGITIYPRLEALVTARPRAAHEDSRSASTGISELDAMFSGGVSRGCPTLVLGPSGSGKTIVGLHFLAAGVRAGENCLYLSFNEPPERLLSKAARIGLDLQPYVDRFSTRGQAGTRPPRSDLQPYVDRGALQLIWHPSVDLLADAIAHEVLESVRAHSVKRVVIDSLMGFKDAIMVAERTQRFLAAFTNELSVAGATTYLCEETRALFSPGVEVPVTGVSTFVDNILFVRQVEVEGELCRIVAVLKTRESPRDAALRQFTISEKGMIVVGALHDAEAILTGTAHSTRRRADLTRKIGKKKTKSKSQGKRRGGT